MSFCGISGWSLAWGRRIVTPKRLRIASAVVLVGLLGWWWIRSSTMMSARRDAQAAFAEAEAALQSGNLPQARRAWTRAHASAIWGNAPVDRIRLLAQYEREANVIANLLTISPVRLIDDHSLLEQHRGEWIILDTTALQTEMSSGLQGNRLDLTLLGAQSGSRVALALSSIERILIDANPTHVIVAAQIADADPAHPDVLRLDSTTAFLWAHAELLTGWERHLSQEFLNCLARQARLLEIDVPPSKSIATSKSFRDPLAELSTLLELPDQTTQLYWRDGVMVVWRFRDESSRFDLQQEFSPE